MKVGLIAFSDRNTIPFIEIYEKILKEKQIEYECILWDRYSNSDVDIKGNDYILHIECLPGKGKFNKIIPMVKYKNVVEKIIKRNKYTHLIILTAQPGFLLYKLLLKNYENKYIFDYRDYSYEKIAFYKKRIDTLINKSFFTPISSKGFLRFLAPNSKIIPCHNIDSNFENVNVVQNIWDNKTITIGFVGGIRYFNENSRLIDSLANNNRFILKFIGRANADCNLEEYCKNKKISNVIFEGAFNNSDKPKIYKGIDFINSIYGNRSLEVTTALPNRLYDALVFKKPIIVSKGTYLAEIVETYGVGLSIDIYKDNLAMEIEKFIDSYNEQTLLNNIHRLLCEVEIEQKRYLEQIYKFVEL